MSSLTDDINDKIEAGRKTIEDRVGDTFDDLPDTDMRKMPPGIVAAGLVAAIVGVGLLGWLVYRNRRSGGGSLPRRGKGMLREAMDALPAMPEGITRLPSRARARIRR
jgi:hypothetical protein